MNFDKYKDGKDLLQKTGLSVDEALAILRREIKDRETS